MAAAAKFDAGSQRRRAMIAKVKIAQKELGLDDATYRAVLERVTGRTSAADCTEAQLAFVLEEFRAKGWTPVVAARHSAAPAPRRPRPADSAVAGKARAMWISLHQLGVVRDSSERALEAFARRQLDVEQLQWADQALTYKLIEALKGMAERAGWSQDLAGIAPHRHVRVLQENLALAMAARLGQELKPFTVWNLSDRQLADLRAAMAAGIACLPGPKA